MKKLLISLLFILVVIGITMFVVFNPTSSAYNQQNEIPYSEFIEAVRNQAITEVIIDGKYVDGRRPTALFFPPTILTMSS